MNNLNRPPPAADAGDQARYNMSDQRLFNLFDALLGGIPIPMPPMTNVIVRPTVQQINAATTIAAVSTPITDVCAICQDGYEVGNEKRSLNVCRHSFHRGCIDTWFQENVHCPVCRHDIREPAATATGATD
jgi:hypothetical protein